MPKAETQNTPSLASFKWLGYLGLVFVILSIYTIGQFYYHYSDDIFSISLTFTQHIKLSILSIGSMFSELLFPLLFFSGALIYHSVRLKNIKLLHALRRDLLIIIPLAIILWIYGAFGQQPVKSRFYMMIYEIQDLEAGEKLVQNPELAELFKSPDLIGLYSRVDTLESQIKNAESKLINNLGAYCSPSQIDELFRKVDFGSSSVKPEDIHNSSNNWDGVKRKFHHLAANTRGHLQYIETLHDQQENTRNEIKVIHFTPFYILLFMLFGILLGYLIPLHKGALIAILMAIGFVWYYAMTVLESLFSLGLSNILSLLTGKIVLLILLNTVLLIVTIRVHHRNKEVHL